MCMYIVSLQEDKTSVELASDIVRRDMVVCVLYGADGGGGGGGRAYLWVLPLSVG